MKYTPMLYTGAMVRAMLLGLKSKTRRIVKGSFEQFEEGWSLEGRDPRSTREDFSPYGQPGDRIWVRENFYSDTREDLRTSVNPAVIYAATPELAKEKLGKGVQVCRYLDGAAPTRAASKRNLIGHKFQKLRPCIHLPRWASRITLELVSVDLERVQDISVEDAIAEGLTKLTKDQGRTWKYGIPDMDGLPGVDDDGWPWHDWSADPVEAYRRLWESINGPGSWAANPLVWVLGFKVIEEGGAQ